MVTQSHIDGGWNELKGKVKQVWGDINDDELTHFEGSFDELVGLIQRKTGDARETVEQQLQDFDANASGMADEATAAAQEYIDQASVAAREKAEQLRDQFDNYRSEAEQLIRRRPAESLMVGFGAGVLLGVVLGLSGRNK